MRRGRRQPQPAAGQSCSSLSPPTNMYRFPPGVLQKLKCAKCDGFLRTAPIVVNNAGHQLCGKCCKLIPQQEMIDYRHELGLEAVAELFVFPCRYHLHGCDETFRFNAENGHEANCPHRSPTQTAPDVVGDSVQAASQVGEDRQRCQDEIDYYGRTCVTRTPEFRIVMRCDYEHAAMLDSNKIKVTLVVHKVHNNITDLINDKDSDFRIEAVIDTDDGPSITCLSAKTANQNVERSHAKLEEVPAATNLYGWNVSELPDACSEAIPLQELRGRPQYVNAAAGDVTSNYCDIPRSGSISSAVSSRTKQNKGVRSCLIRSCNCVLMEDEMESHMRLYHPDYLVDSNTITETVFRDDKEWLLACYGKLFRCVYNYYCNQMDVLVIYLHGDGGETKFKYKVKIFSPKNPSTYVTKRSRCMCQNNAALDKGAQFEVDALSKEFGVKMNKFDIAVELSAT